MLHLACTTLQYICMQLMPTETPASAMHFEETLCANALTNFPDVGAKDAAGQW